MKTFPFPTTAQELREGAFAGRDLFFLLAQVEKNSQGFVVKVRPDHPIVVNSDPAVVQQHVRGENDLRGRILHETGALLPTRAEMAGRAPMSPELVKKTQGLYTIASGAILWIQGADGVRRLDLKQSDAAKPASPLAWNVPSGLGEDDPFHTALAEMTEESCILMPKKDGSGLVGLNFRLPESLPSLRADFKNAVYQVREKQREYIQKGLKEKYPKYAGLPIEWRMIQTEVLPDYDDLVRLHFLNQVHQFRMHVKIDEKAHSVNMHPVLLANLCKADLGDVDVNNVISVDPERFGRNARLCTLQQAWNLANEYTNESKGCTPAVKDYLSRCVGGPRGLSP